MEKEQALLAVQPKEAAPDEGAGNQRERTMSSLLQQMSTPAVPEELLPTETAGEDAGEGPGEAGEVEAQPKAASAVGMTGVEEAVPGAEGTDAAEPDGRKAKNFRGRWGHLNEQERRVVELTTRRGLTLAEAYRAVYGDSAAPPSVPQAEPSAEGSGAELEQLDRKIADQQQRLGELRQQKAENKGDLGAYDTAAEAYLEAREEMRELQARRQEAARQAAAHAESARQQAEAAAREALGEEFPDALLPGTELHTACEEELDYLRQANNPLLHDPQVQYKIARRMARVLGYPRVAIPPAPGAETGAAAPVAARRTVRPVPTGGSLVEAPAATLERRLAGARSPDAMLELMREIGTPFEALLKK